MNEDKDDDEWDDSDDDIDSIAFELHRQEIEQRYARRRRNQHGLQTDTIHIKLTNPAISVRNTVFYHC